MSAGIKHGDRVKVEYEGVVRSSIDEDGDVLVEEGRGGSRYVRAEFCTVIPKPYVPQVGDLVRRTGGVIGEIDSLDPGRPTVFGVAGRVWSVFEVELLARPGEVYIPKDGDA